MPRKYNRAKAAPRLEGLENRTLLSQGGWQGYALNPQHTALSPVASAGLGLIHWQAPVDLAPQYSGNDLLIHYGSPLVTAANTVLIPVKTGASGGFEIQARSGATGSLQWTVTSDYTLMPRGGTNGYDWTPSYSPTLTPQNQLYFAGNGGTVITTASPDAAGPTPPTTSRLAFFGLSNYNANPSAYNTTVFIDTPITADAAGDIFFGFLVTGSNPLGLSSGVARIGANGTGSYVGVVAGTTQVATNSAPALSNDGSTLYVLESSGNFGSGKLVALDSHTLAVKAQVTLMDPYTDNPAVISNDATASPTVGPDGDVYIGVLENPFASNHDRGWLLHFSGDLATTKIPGAFGWDDTASIVPASMVPSYHGSSTYLLMTKYNNYAGEGGDGVNEIAILDPNAMTDDPVTGTCVMQEVETIAGPTPDPEFISTHPDAVREWCINSAAVDPATDSVLVGSEDGNLYRWNLATNTFTQHITLTSGVGEAYTPTLIGPDGTVYAINNATLFAIGDVVGDSGFERIQVGAGQFQYRPSGSNWSFAGNSGISANNSGFTSGNPPAPQGQQVAFLQQTGSISQAVSGWAAGSYALSFDAAQRGNFHASKQDFSVLVDGAVVGTFTPSGTSYQSYTTAAFTVAAGAHTITFQGLDSAGGDNTAFVDAVARVIVNPIGDAGFEQVQVGAGQFRYLPTGSPWTFAGNSGISANNSGFTSGNPPAPQGLQVAFLQETGSFSQTVTGWAAGSYTLSFDAAQRGNYQASKQDFSVLVDRAVVGTFTPAGKSYQSYTTAAFTVGAGAHTITFQGLDSAGGDNTAFVDLVTLTSLATIGDAGFEQVLVGGGQFKYLPTGSPWTFAGNSGISANNSGFTSGNPPAPQGLQVAFLQETGSFSQTVTDWAAGSYTLSFDAAQRGSNPASKQDFSVLVDGVLVGIFTPAGTSYQSYTTAAFTVGAGVHTITFQGLDSAGGDNTAFVDLVSVTSLATIGDAGFEQVQVGAGQFRYLPTGSPWTFTGSSGISANNSGFTSGNPPAPQGQQVAFLQETGSFSQAVPGWASGSYTLSFDAAQRGNYQASKQDFSVLVDGAVVGTFTPSGTSYQSYTTAAFTVAAGAHTITFRGLDSAGGDNTAFVDAIKLAIS